jgi:predicted ArsR family transcriptional regulator
MTRVEKYRQALKATEKVLKKGFISAADLADELKTSRQTVYARIEALKELVTVEERFDRVGRRGPVTTLYKITKGRVPDAPRAAS